MQPACSVGGAGKGKVLSSAENDRGGEKCSVPNRLRDPIQILRAPILDHNRDAFRKIVRMQFPNGVAHIRKFLVGGLDQQQPFRAGFHLTLPAIDRFNLGNDIHARCETIPDQMVRNFARFIGRARSRQDDSLISHIKSAVGQQLLLRSGLRGHIHAELAARSQEL